MKAFVHMLRRPLLLAPILLAACAVIYTKTSTSGGDRIRVSHAAHKKAQVECIACHESIYDASDLKGDFLPPESKCMECHADKKQAGQCGMCHTDVKKAGPYPKPEGGVPQMNLSHAKHIELVKEDCSVCHKTLPEPDSIVKPLPPMSACLECHEHRTEYNAGNCSRCHTDLSHYKLKPLSAFSHQGDFVKQHGRTARTNSDTCAKCHEQNFCADCHASTVGMPIELKFPERVDSDFIHRGDFLGRHSIEASADPVSCRRCHGSSFCSACHDAQNLTPFGKNPRDPHPAGFSFPASPSFHGPVARRDIASCAPCHDQGAQSVCVECHKSGGVGGNPHPLGWSSKHGQDEIHKNGMCLFCHI